MFNGGIASAIGTLSFSLDNLSVGRRSRCWIISLYNDVWSPALFRTWPKNASREFTSDDTAISLGDLVVRIVRDPLVVVRSAVCESRLPNLSVRQAACSTPRRAWNHARDRAIESPRASRSAHPCVILNVLAGSGPTNSLN